jgi:ATP-dependent DNA helicase RecG
VPKFLGAATLGKNLIAFRRLLDNDKPRNADVALYAPVTAILRSKVDRISTLTEDREGAQVTIEVEPVDYIPAQTEGSPWVVKCRDFAGDAIRIGFFNTSPQVVRNRLKLGQLYHVSGRLSIFREDPAINNPARIVARGAVAGLPGSESVYMLTQGLTTKACSKAILRVLEACWRELEDLPEWQSPDVRLSFYEALQTIHSPELPDDIAIDSPAMERLAYDELLAGQLADRLKRAGRKRTREPMR